MRYVIAVGPNAADDHPGDYLRRLSRAVEDYCWRHGVALAMATRAAKHAVREAEKRHQAVVYLTAGDIARYLTMARRETVATPAARV
jgi:hypothetical protein